MCPVNDNNVHKVVSYLTWMDNLLLVDVCPYNLLHRDDELHLPEKSNKRRLKWFFKQKKTVHFNQSKTKII